MTPRALYRWAAAALVVTGVSLVVGEVLHPTQPFADSLATKQWAIAHVFWWLGGLAGALGFAGLYLRQREALGVLGFVGSGFAVLGSVLISCAMYFEAFIVPALAARSPELFIGYPAGGGWDGFLVGVLAAGALLGVGLFLFGFTMYRAHVLPRWAVVLAVVGGVPFAVNFLLPRSIAISAALAFGIGLAGLGHGLWKRSEIPGARPRGVNHGGQ